MTRRCSHCGRNGHNSRTCPDRGIKLFGVRLTSNSGLSMMRSFSMGNISQCPANTPAQSDSGGSGGYVSDSLTPSTSKCCERKKGVPWSEEEHRRFLVGLGTVGKGDWRGISRNFVPTRTPAQVASHAQKYFLRQSNLNKRKRRSSLFDISADLQRSTGLYLGRSRESIEQKQAILPRSSGFLGPGSFSIGIDGINSFPIPLWADLGMEPPSNLPVSATCNKFIWSEAKLNNSAKPTSKISPFLAATDESVEHGTQLSLSIAPPSPDPPSSSLNLDHQSSRHSALHSSKMYTFQWKSKQCYQSGLECLIHSVI